MSSPVCKVEPVEDDHLQILVQAEEEAHVAPRLRHRSVAYARPAISDQRCHTSLVSMSRCAARSHDQVSMSPRGQADPMHNLARDCGRFTLTLGADGLPCLDFAGSRAWYVSAAPTRSAAAKLVTKRKSSTHNMGSSGASNHGIRRMPPRLPPTMRLVARQTLLIQPAVVYCGSLGREAGIGCVKVSESEAALAQRPSSAHCRRPVGAGQSHGKRYR